VNKLFFVNGFRTRHSKCPCISQEIARDTCSELGFKDLEVYSANGDYHVLYKHFQYLEDRWDPQTFEAECGVGTMFFHYA
jgi:hypothetical protein